MGGLPKMPRICRPRLNHSLKHLHLFTFQPSLHIPLHNPHLRLPYLRAKVPFFCLSDGGVVAVEGWRVRAGRVAAGEGGVVCDAHFRSLLAVHWVGRWGLLGLVCQLRIFLGGRGDSDSSSNTCKKFRKAGGVNISPTDRSYNTLLSNKRPL